MQNNKLSFIIKIIGAQNYSTCGWCAIVNYTIRMRGADERPYSKPS